MELQNTDLDRSWSTEMLEQSVANGLRASTAAIFAEPHPFLRASNRIHCPGTEHMFDTASPEEAALLPQLSGGVAAPDAGAVSGAAPASAPSVGASARVEGSLEDIELLSALRGSTWDEHTDDAGMVLREAWSAQEEAESSASHEALCAGSDDGAVAAASSDPLAQRVPLLATPASAARRQARYGGHLRTRDGRRLDFRGLSDTAFDDTALQRESAQRHQHDGGEQDAHDEAPADEEEDDPRTGAIWQSEPVLSPFSSLPQWFGPVDCEDEAVAADRSQRRGSIGSGSDDGLEEAASFLSPIHNLAARETVLPSQQEDEVEHRIARNLWEELERAEPDREEVSKEGAQKAAATSAAVLSPAHLRILQLHTKATALHDLVVLAEVEASSDSRSSAIGSADEEAEDLLEPIPMLPELRSLSDHVIDGSEAAQKETISAYIDNWQKIKLSSVGYSKFASPAQRQLFADPLAATLSAYKRGGTPLAASRSGLSDPGISASPGPAQTSSAQSDPELYAAVFAGSPRAYTPRVGFTAASRSAGGLSSPAAMRLRTLYG
jgi:hypothetical protein